MNARLVPPLVAVGLLLPFLGKALHVDDPLFVWMARRIAEHPFDPYGGTLNWYGTEQPLHEIAQNPPLASYFLALAGALVGWSERALHLAFLVPAALAAAGIHRLARRFTSEPLLAALAAILTPAFLVSATTLMCDVPMLALHVWALALWIEGTDERNPRKLAAAGLLAALAGLAKYFGASAALVMALWSLARRQKGDLVWLVPPLAALMLFELATEARYGHGLLTTATGYVAMAHASVGQSVPVKVALALVFLGGGLPIVAPRRSVAVAAALATLLVAAIVLVRPAHLPGLFAGDDVSWGVVVQMAVFATLGLAALGLAIADLRARRDASSVLLAAWIAGAFLFAAVVNWTVNVRTLLPMAPALGILLARRMEGARVRWWMLAPAAALALAVAWADARLANAGRAAARTIHARHGGGPGTLWFQGHWGFQYHLQELGGKPLDLLRYELRAGDRVVIPRNASNRYDLPAGASELEAELAFETLPWLATMGTSVGAGFYASAYGCLPFSFGAAPPERYDVFRVTRAISAPR